MAIRVTVVIPAYNATKTIHDGLDSFARQSFPADEVELIIVDDESTDGTPEYIEHYVKDGARTRGCAYFAKLIGAGGGQEPRCRSGSRRVSPVH